MRLGGFEDLLSYSVMLRMVDLNNVDLVNSGVAALTARAEYDPSRELPEDLTESAVPDVFLDPS